MDSGKVFLGVLAGITAGALLGILFAPAKGSETREKIVRKGEEEAGALQEKFDKFVDSITEKFEKIMEEVSELTQKEKTKSEESEKEVKSH